MHTKVLDTLETALNTLGIIVSVQDLNDILNIILLSVSILSIIIRGSIAVYNHVKNKEYEKVPNDLDDTTKQLKDLQDKSKGDKQ